MGEIILQVHDLPSQHIIERCEDVKSEIIEYPPFKFPEVQRITEIVETQSEYDVPSFAASIPPQLNQQTNLESVTSEDKSPSSVSITVNEPSQDSPQDDSPKNPPRKRKEVVFEPPPYEILPPQRHKFKSLSFDDLPPPYDPSLRRSMVSIISLENEVRINESDSIERNCGLGIFMELGFCCSLEQVIVTIAIIGTFIFLGLSY